MEFSSVCSTLYVYIYSYTEGISGFRNEACARPNVSRLNRFLYKVATSFIILLMLFLSFFIIYYKSRRLQKSVRVKTKISNKNVKNKFIANCFSHRCAFARMCFCICTHANILYLNMCTYVCMVYNAMYACEYFYAICCSAFFIKSPLPFATIYC